MARADQAWSGQLIKLYEEIESLRTKQLHPYEKLDELRTASPVAWADLQGAVQRAVDHFR